MPSSSSLSPSLDVKTHMPDDGQKNGQLFADADSATSTKASKPKRKLSVTYSDQFEGWWLIYPRKTAKGRAWAAWPRAVAIVSQVRDVPQAQAVEWLIAITRVFADSPKGQSEFVPHPATWLNDRRFEDDVTVWDRLDATNKVNNHRTFNGQPDPRGNLQTAADYLARMKAEHANHE